MIEIPEGQISRDEAFWRTFDAVQAERHHAWEVLRCEREGHTFSLSENRCVDCSMPYDEALQHMGAVARGNQWVFEAPAPSESSNPRYLSNSKWTIIR